MLAKNYTQALYDLHLKESNSDVLLEKFIATLRQSGHLALLPKIAHSFEKLCKQKAKEERAKLWVADIRQAQEAMGELKKQRMSLTEKNLDTREDKNLVGGYVFEGKGQRIDASYKNSLLKLYKQMISI